ncbi:MAG: hypothetical protein AMXMBFR13_34580 [Phycisphaerae bacterium]
MADSYTDSELATAYNMRLGEVRREIRSGRMHATESGGVWTATREVVQDWAKRCHRLFQFGGRRRRLNQNNFEDPLT